MSNKIQKRLEALNKLEKLTLEQYNIDNIIVTAKEAYLAGDVGLAAALLVRGSQYCEDIDLIPASIVLLATAEGLLND